MKTIYHICIYITLLASTLFTTASCEDWLEVKSPTSRPTVDFFQTPVQAEQALLGILTACCLFPNIFCLCPTVVRMMYGPNLQMINNVTTWTSVSSIRIYILPEQ